MVRTIRAHLRLPIFSIKNPEAFQVRASLPIPQPSTLIGMFAYCLGAATGIGTVAGKIVKNWIDEGKLLAARASLLSDSLPMITSTTVLRRFRIADKAHYYDERETKLKYIKVIHSAIREGRLDRVKSMLEKDLMDAFYREYVMGHEVLCVWAISDNVEFQPKWVRLAHRLGDTESICTVLKVEEIEAEAVEKRVVETCFPAYLNGSMKSIEGDYTIVKMCDEGFFYTRDGKPRKFAVPCKVEMVKVRRGAVPAIIPSKIRIIYRRPVKTIRTTDGEEVTAYVPAERRRGGREER